MNKIKTRKISISTKIFALVVMTALIINILTCVVAYRTISSSLYERAKTTAIEQASIAAKELNGDFTARYINADGDDDEAYQHISQTLSCFLQSESVDYIYLMTYADENNFKFIVDTDPEDPADFGELYETEEEMSTAYKGAAVATSEASFDEWGIVYSGYAPVRDSSQNVIGIVGVDINVSNVSSSVIGMVTIIIIANIFGLIAAIVIASVFTTKIRKSFAKLNTAMLDIASADGDLTRQIYNESGDELETLSHSFNLLLEKTRATISTVASSSEAIATNMETIKNMENNCNSMTANIQSSISNIVAALEETTASIQEINAQAILANGKLEEMSDITLESGNRVTSVDEKAFAMKDFAISASEEIQDSISSLSEKFQKEIEKTEAVSEIQSLTATIKKISNQTNLLALNASIEAARAGEAGKGFAIVADEIGKLASDSDSAASQIHVVSEEVSEAINGLLSVTQEMFEFINQKVLTDYTGFANSSNDFSDNMKKLQEQIATLQKLSLEYKTEISSITTSISHVGIAAESNNVDVVAISDDICTLSESIEEIDEATKQTSSSVDDMQALLTEYRF